MSQESLSKIVERASTDPAFRAQLQSNPESALAGYDLTAEERAALMSGDPGRMQGLGVDARVSKMQQGPWEGDPFSGGTTAG